MKRFSPAGMMYYLAVSATVTFLGMFFAPAIRQDLDYHAFVDQRRWLGVPNAADVLSNLFFLWGGLAGLRGLQHKTRPIEPTARRAWRVFFLGVFATGFGSAYYHWAPDNHRLVWDRLPMTVAFMGVLVAVISERLSPLLARRLFLPLLLLGAASVFYWDWTERRNMGDLRPYAWVQYYPLIFALPPLLLFRPAPRPDTGAWIWLFAGYLAAKICEALDAPVFDSLQFVSGHTLKHVFAGLAVLPMACLFGRR